MQDDILLLSQLSQMAAALLAGVAGGVAFDIYQRLCYGSIKRRQRPAAYIKGDLLFGVILISLWLLFWFSCTDGSLRFSVLIWLIIGFSIYFGLFRQRLITLFHKLPHHRKRHHRQESPSSKRLQSKNIQVVDKGSHLLCDCYQHGHHVCGSIRQKLSSFRAHKEEKKQ